MQEFIKEYMASRLPLAVVSADPSDDPLAVDEDQETQQDFAEFTRWLNESLDLGRETVELPVNNGASSEATPATSGLGSSTDVAALPASGPDAPGSTNTPSGGNHPATLPGPTPPVASEPSVPASSLEPCPKCQAVIFCIQSALWSIYINNFEYKTVKWFKMVQLFVMKSVGIKTLTHNLLVLIDAWSSLFQGLILCGYQQHDHPKFGQVSMFVMPRCFFLCVCPPSGKCREIEQLKQRIAEKKAILLLGSSGEPMV